MTEWLGGWIILLYKVEEKEAKIPAADPTCAMLAGNVPYVSGIRPKFVIPPFSFLSLCRVKNMQTTKY
jgi:hypothetical protein